MTRRGRGRGSLRCGALTAALVACAACAPAHDAATLFRDLQDEDPEVRLDARETLARILSDGDYGVFVRGIDGEEPTYRVQSILYLARMRQPGARAALRDLLRVDRRMMLPINPIRLKASRQENDSRILVAHLIASGGGDPEALPVLLNGLDASLAPDVVEGTCFAIGALGDARGIPFLASAARSPEVKVARAAVQALGRFREPEALEAVRAAASHLSEEVRGDALSALDIWEPGEVIDVLEMVAGSDPAAEIRASAIHRLGRSGDTTLVPFLIERLASEDEMVRLAALGALGQLTGERLGPRPQAWRRWWAEHRERSGAREGR
ncbi:MAG: HEAT repeat domain-containing protein [Acidobacteriota bacterium]